MSSAIDSASVTDDECTSNTPLPSGGQALIISSLTSLPSANPPCPPARPSSPPASESPLLAPPSSFAPQSSPPTPWDGFKLVGDNIDKNVRPSFQILDCQTRSLHYFHCYGVKDRVNLSNLSDVVNTTKIIDPTSLVVSPDEWDSFKIHCMVLITRILVQYMEEFKDSKEVVWHIPSRFSEELSKRSIVLPLGVQLKNENKLDEMADIVDDVHIKYFPTIVTEDTITLPDQTIRTFENPQFSKVLLGGDQLTAARVRGATILRSSDPKREYRLEGITLVVEDWHARMTLMKVLWKRLFSNLCAYQKGTMYQMKNLINRSFVPSSPECNMKAAEDFLLLVLQVHTVAAAKDLLQYDVDVSVSYIAKYIVNTHLLLPPNEAREAVAEVDGVTMYARELITLALVWHSFEI